MACALRAFLGFRAQHLDPLATRQILAVTIIRAMCVLLLVLLTILAAALPLLNVRRSRQAWFVSLALVFVLLVMASCAIRLLVVATTQDLCFATIYAMTQQHWGPARTRITIAKLLTRCKSERYVTTPTSVRRVPRVNPTQQVVVPDIARPHCLWAGIVVLPPASPDVPLLEICANISTRVMSARKVVQRSRLPTVILTSLIETSLSVFRELGAPGISPLLRGILAYHYLP